MTEVAFEPLEWRAGPMPGGSGPVQLALLPRLDDGAFRAFVRFPAGWSRPEAGHYPCAEEFLVLEGELGLNGTAWPAGGHARIPAWRMRRDLGSPTGCLVFAWFEAAPRWIPGEPAAEPPAGARRHRTWIVERAQAAPLAAGWNNWETLDLRDRAWRTDGAPLRLDGAAAGELLLRVW